jgi:hypothetical protein
LAERSIKESTCRAIAASIVFLFGTLCAYVIAGSLVIVFMTDVDFIRLSALVFATRLIGKTTDPISEGTEMAERLLNKLKEKED